MKLVYFSWIRERVGMDEEEVNLPEHVTSVENLFEWLAGRGDAFSGLFEQPELVRVALDHVHVIERSAPITGASEIALFPPMSGG